MHGSFQSTKIPSEIGETVRYNGGELDRSCIEISCVPERFHNNLVILYNTGIFLYVIILIDRKKPG